ncbi:MAG: seg [Parcubacteria group bacterium]|nr:seg [Parcubacteria group bacterium]
MQYPSLKKHTQKGFTLFIAIVVTATLLLVSTGIIALALKEAFLTSASRDSQFAFFAADTGAECAVYWDVRNPSGFSAFSTSTGSTINCNQDASNPTNPIVPGVGGSSQSSFDLTFLPDPYCAHVTVTKTSATTTIDSRGYNSCDPSNTRRVERAVRVTY